jgi:hypothetical protein
MVTGYDEGMVTVTARPQATTPTAFTLCHGHLIASKSRAIAYGEALREEVIRNRGDALSSITRSTHQTKVVIRETL